MCPSVPSQTPFAGPPWPRKKKVTRSGLNSVVILGATPSAPKSRGGPFYIQSRPKSNPSPTVPHQPHSPPTHPRRKTGRPRLGLSRPGRRVLPTAWRDRMWQMWLRCGCSRRLWPLSSFPSCSQDQGSLLLLIGGRPIGPCYSNSVSRCRGRGSSQLWVFSVTDSLSPTPIQMGLDPAGRTARPSGS